MIKLENVSFKYDNVKDGCLHDINLKVNKGECVLLCGESGCGKTTITRLINGLIPHFYEGELTGNVFIKGEDVKKSSLENISKIVGSVFQNPRSQFFCLDTTGELAFGPENRCLPKEEILSIVDDVTNQFNIKNLLGKNIFNLSGGEKQKIACAGVSAVSPDIIVLDEPTSNLDEDAIENIKEILEIWKNEGKTIIIAEHRLSWLKNIVDRVVYLKKGAVVFDESSKDFYSRSNDSLNVLGLRGIVNGTDYLNGPIGFYSLNGDADYDEKEKYIFNDFEYKYEKNKKVIEINDLEVPKNAVVAVVGHNGAGKSTFSKCLCGIQKGFKGNIQINNKKYKGKKLRTLCYMVMQDVNHQLFTDLVIEEVVLGMEHENEEYAMKVLEKMDLVEFKDRHPMSLSGGQKQRLAICSAYLSNRDIIILVEPTSGLDYSRMEETANLIKEISNDKTVFIVTHDAELIEKCCTHILHIEKPE